MEYNPEITIPNEMWKEICELTMPLKFEIRFILEKGGFYYDPYIMWKISRSDMTIELGISLYGVKQLIRTGRTEIGDHEKIVTFDDKIEIKKTNARIIFSNSHSIQLVNEILRLHQVFYDNYEIDEDSYSEIEWL